MCNIIIIIIIIFIIIVIITCMLATSLTIGFSSLLCLLTPAEILKQSCQQKSA